MIGTNWIGTKEEKLKVTADDVLNVIAEGRDVHVEYAVIVGDLDIESIADQLERDENGKRVIRGDILIQFSEIRGKTNFASATFDGNVGFVSTNFNGMAIFEVAIFKGNTDFKEAVFSEDADFKGTTYSRNANFRNAIFHGDADFGLATFSRSTYFWDAAFNRHADFWDATFSGNTHFTRSTFNEQAVFDSATFGKKVDFSPITMKYPASFAEVRFSENTVPVGLWNHILRPLFHPIVWLLTVGKLRLSDKMVTDFSNFNTTTVMDSTSNPYLKQYIDDEQWIKSWRWRSWWRQFLFIIWEATSHCGRSIGLWACWALFFAFLFALAYTPSPDWMPQWWCDFWQQHGTVFEQEVQAYQNNPPHFWSCFYFSMVTFTTLGFGDIAAANSIARFLVTLEVMLGYIMLGGLVSIFANKLARRA